MEALFSIFKTVLILAVSIGAYVLAVVVVVRAPVASSYKDPEYLQLAQLPPDRVTDLASTRYEAMRAFTGRGTPAFGPKIFRNKICSIVEN